MATVVVFLKIVSFFHVVNDVNDFLLVIRERNLKEDNAYEYFRKSQINKEVEKEVNLIELSSYLQIQG